MVELFIIHHISRPPVKMMVDIISYFRDVIEDFLTRRFRFLSGVIVDFLPSPPWHTLSTRFGQMSHFRTRIRSQLKKTTNNNATNVIKRRQKLNFGAWTYLRSLGGKLGIEEIIRLTPHLIIGRVQKNQ